MNLHTQNRLKNNLFVQQVMKYVQEIKKLIDDISSKTINVKNYEKMTINEISERLRER